MIKFNKYHVTNGLIKARVWYCIGNRVDNRKAVTLYAKNYHDKLSCIFSENDVINKSDYVTDYFEKDRVVLFEDHPLYLKALERAELNLKIKEKKND